MEDSELIYEEWKVPKYFPENTKDFASLDNFNLTKFEYGDRMDNALTYMIWHHKYDQFVYLLQRGIDPLAGNEDNINAFQASILCH